jgi:surface antigen
VNPDTGGQFQMTPTQTYQAAQGPCRDYTLHAVIDGRTEQIHGTACRQPDGSWQAIG